MKICKKPAKTLAKAGFCGLINPGPKADVTEKFEEGDNTYRLMGDIGCILCVDPGLNGTGWAVFDRKDGSITPPIASGSISVERNKHPWWTEAHNIAGLVKNQCSRYGCFCVYVELPKFFESAGAGMSAARDGDLVKLAVLTGLIFGTCTAPPGNGKIVPVVIADWKGQLPKDICNARVLKKIQAKFPKWKPTTNTTHELDAVGIGLFVKGWF